jgi:hypothetical protein
MAEPVELCTGWTHAEELDRGMPLRRSLSGAPFIELSGTGSVWDAATCGSAPPTTGFTLLGVQEAEEFKSHPLDPGWRLRPHFSTE